MKFNFDGPGLHFSDFKDCLILQLQSGNLVTFTSRHLTKDYLHTCVA